MKKKKSMMQPTSYNDFNPLDVLAAAASLQRRTDEPGENEENENQNSGGSGSNNDEESTSAEDEDGTGTVRKASSSSSSVSQNKNHAIEENPKDTGKISVPTNGETILVKKAGVEIVARSQPAVKKPAGATTVVTLRDKSKMIIPTQQGNKALTVLKINKQQMTDHSYAFVCQLQNLRNEEDEGYSSRSSMDDEAEDSAHQKNKNSCIGGLVGRASTPTGAQKVIIKASTSGAKPSPAKAQVMTDITKKPAKIVIVSKDSKLQHLITGKNIVSPAAVPTSPAAENNGSAVLRTLLGQGPAIKTPVKGPSPKVLLAGGKAGQVISVLKGGNVSINSSSSQEGTAADDDDDRNFTPPLPQTSRKRTVSATVLAESKVSNTDKAEEVVMVEPKEQQGLSELLEKDTPEQEAQNSEQSSIEKGSNDPTAEVSQTETDDVTTNITDCEQDVAAPPNDIENTETHVVDPPVSEDSCRHWSDTSTEDETSCDSKGAIIIDTTPVLSPSTDYSSPLLSPVCERDTPIMSPMVDSQGTCDLFRLPGNEKHLKVISNTKISELRENSNQDFDDKDESVKQDVSSVEQCLPQEEGEDKQTEQVKESEDTVNQSDTVFVPEEHEEYTANKNSLLEFENNDDNTQTDNFISDSFQPDESSSTDSALTDPQPAEDELDPIDKELSDIHKAKDNKIVAIQSTDDNAIPDTTLTDQTTREDASQDVDPAENSTSVFHVKMDEPSFLTTSDSINTKNQYIIEDDESPVAKFGQQRLISSEESDLDSTGPITLAIPTAKATGSTSVKFNSLESTAVKQPPLKDTVKLLVANDTNSRSLFTAVRRPLAPGVKAVPGNLQVFPVVSSSKAPGSLMHVVPVTKSRGAVTQIIPKTTGQIVTDLPILDGKTVMLPDAGNGRMSTLLVPVNVPTASATTAQPISIIQDKEGTLVNIKQNEDTSVRKSVTETVLKSPKQQPQRKDVTSPLVFHGRITPVSPAMSEQSDKTLSSPENSFKGGFSGIIMGGRATPDSFDNLRNSRSELDKGLRTPNSSILDSDDSVSSEASFATKKEIGIGSIGSMGSFSWKNYESPSRGLTPIGTGGSGVREFVRIQGGEVKTGIQFSDEDSIPSVDSFAQKKARAKSADGSMARCVQAYRKRKKLSESLQGLPPSVNEIHPQTAQLHPLIDHDYCMFTEFNAQIQSSIIATTESKTKIEKKYAKKSKAVRTKAGRALITEESIKPTIKLAEEKQPQIKGKRGRLKKSVLYKDKYLTDEDVSLDAAEEQLQLKKQMFVPSDFKTRKVESKPNRSSERRAKLQALKDDKNYVKITGSYQDDFVYFATKNKRSRPRKSLEDPNMPNQKQPQVGGMAVFDWYKDLSRADKSSHFGTPFGTPTASAPSSPATFQTHHETDTKASAAASVNSGVLSDKIPSASSGDPMITSSTSSTSVASTPSTSTGTLAGPYRPGATPIHESEVADLVCDLSGIDTIETPAVPQVQPVNDVDLSPYFMGNHDVKTDEVQSVSNNTSENPVTTEELPSAYVDRMAEQVRCMLNSMGADELENLELKLGGVDGAPTGMADTSFDSYLSSFPAENPVNLTPPSTTNNLCDLDEINDNDLLRSDLGNMNNILGDVKNTVTAAPSLKPSASAPSLLTHEGGEKLPVHDPSPYGYSRTVEFGPMSLDKSELFPEVATPTTPDVSALAADSAPELTIVSMYWNDLPGLVLMGQQYVRLVDIHKQVLPAKDTGILKKRCQMMGLPIANCSELQRDFLVRYANAAKSKSTVIVSKEAAQTLIGFYVEPKSRPAKQSSLDMSPLPCSQGFKEKHIRATSTPMLKPKETSSQAYVEGHLQSAGLSMTTPSKKPIGGKGLGKKKKLIQEAAVPTPSTASQSITVGDLKRSARLRHKKICYSDMLLGNHYENQEREKSADAMTFENPNSSLPSASSEDITSGDVVVTAVRDRESESEVSDDHENKEISKISYPEDLEMRRLKVKMRKKTLTLKEKRRLRRLREKVRKKDLKRRLREKARSDRVNTKRKAAAVVAAAMMGLAKSKKKLQATHIFNKKYNQEHCYAAAPESPPKESGEEAAVVVQINTPAVEEFSLTAIENSDPSIKEESSDISSHDSSHSDSIDNNKFSKENKEVLTLQQTEANNKKADILQLKRETLHKAGEGKETEFIPAPQPPKRTPLAVLHRDAVHRLSHRSRGQEGELHTELYSNLDSACISCGTCGEFFSVKRFLKHMHHQNNRDELAHVTLSQILELRNAETVSDFERSKWTEFERRRKELLSKKTQAVKKQPRSTSQSNERKVKHNGTLPKKVSHQTSQVISSHNSTVNNNNLTKTDKLASKAPVILSTQVKHPLRTDNPLSTRQSTRVRKRKQLHPIEKYVFTKDSQPEEVTPTKKQKIESTDDQAPSNRPVSALRDIDHALALRKVRLRLSPCDTKQSNSKYALRNPADSLKH